AKFGEPHRFGKIGIGSLALLQYAETAMIETKRAGSKFGTRARISHPWSMERTSRRARLGDLAAGVAEEFRYEGSSSDHFTAIRLEGVKDDLVAIGSDPTTFYAFLDALRRILPLPWGESPLTAALRDVAPDFVALLERHVQDWSRPVVVHAAWEPDITLTRL